MVDAATWPAVEGVWLQVYNCDGRYVCRALLHSGHSGDRFGISGAGRDLLGYGPVGMGFYTAALATLTYSYVKTCLLIYRLGIPSQVGMSFGVPAMVGVYPVPNHAMMARGATTQAGPNCALGFRVSCMCNTTRPVRKRG